MGTGVGRSVVARSVSLRPADWAIIDKMRGCRWRGVYIAAALHKKWNAENGRLPTGGLIVS